MTLSMKVFLNFPPTSGQVNHTLLRARTLYFISKHLRDHGKCVSPRSNLGAGQSQVKAEQGSWDPEHVQTRAPSHTCCGNWGITWTLCVPLFMSMEIITTTSFKVVVRPTEWVFLRKVSWAVPAAEWVSYGMIAVPGLLTWCPPSGTEDRLGRCGIQEWECP